MTFLSVTLWASWFSTKLRFQISNRIKTEGVVLVVLLGCFTISSCVGFLKSVAYSALHIATRTATSTATPPIFSTVLGHTATATLWFIHSHLMSIFFSLSYHMVDTIKSKTYIYSRWIKNIFTPSKKQWGLVKGRHRAERQIKNWITAWFHVANISFGGDNFEKEPWVRFSFKVPLWAKFYWNVLGNGKKIHKRQVWLQIWIIKKKQYLRH